MIFTSPQCLVHSIFFDFKIFFKNWRIQTPFLNIISPQRRQQTEVGSGGGGGEQQQGGEDEEGVEQLGHNGCCWCIISDIPTIHRLEFW